MGDPEHLIQKYRFTFPGIGSGMVQKAKECGMTAAAGIPHPKNHILRAY
jgi:hypothetical protein